MMQSFSYVRAGSLDEALDHLRQGGAVAHSGGTDLLGCLRDGVLSAKTVVSLSALESLRGITPAADGGLDVGALTPIDEVARDGAIADRYPALSQAAREVASPQLRNQGTLGGNLCQRPRCWYFRGDFHCLKKGGDVCYAVDGENQFHCIFGGGPCYIVFPSDTAPALVAHGARLRLEGAGGSRTLPVEDFYRLPEEDVTRETALRDGEIVTRVLLPPVPRGARGAYRKVRARRAWDFALVSAAVVLHMNGNRVEAAHIVLGGVAPVPWRASAAERALAGKRLDADAIAAAAEAAVEGSSPLAKNGYKVDLVKGVIRDELESLAG
jgi:xanthine dehydrogenase YagS FAD-binding subunit